MAWIKLRHEIHDDLAVVGIACELNITEDEVVGRLARVWTWFDQQTEDGQAPMTTAFIDRIARLPGFAEAMIRQSWLTCDNGIVYLPNFDRHNGSTAKARALGAERQQALRDRRNAARNAARNAPPLRGALPEEIRTDETREDEYPPNPPRGGTGAAGKPAKTPKVQPDIPTALDTAAFREAWATWVEHRREIRKPATPRAMKQQLVNLEAIGHDRAIAAIKHSVGNGWAGIFEAGPSSGAGRTGGGDRLGRVEAPPGKYDKYDLAMQKLQADRLAAKSQGNVGPADNGAVH